jgi:hypothetical protein
MLDTPHEEEGQCNQADENKKPASKGQFRQRKVPQHGNAPMNVATMYGIIYLTVI